MSLAQCCRDLVPSHLVVDLQGCQQYVPLGVDLKITDSSGVKNELRVEASVTDDTCAACVRAPGLASSSRVTDYSLGNRERPSKAGFLSQS